MRRFCISILVFLAGVPGAFAADRILTVGETFTLYFTEIFPNITEEMNDIIVKYNGIGNRGGLRSALQRGIYYGMLPNIAIELVPDKAMTDRSFSQMLQKHFGISLVTDRSPLTLADYERFMSSIRTSYSYQILRAFNAPNETTISQVETPSTGSHLANVDNYYLLEEVYTILQNNYLDAKKLNQTNLIYGATEGLVKELGDAYTVFFRPDISTDFTNSLKSDIVGIGVIIDIDAQGLLLVADVIRHSPAEKAGIVAGDRITKVDNVLVNTKDGITDEIMRLRGKKGTTVEVTIMSGKISKTVSITRDIVHIQEVETEVLAEAFRIIFGEVSFGSDTLIREALQTFLASGKKRLIFDLRNNPGGSMTETRNILNFFISQKQPLVILQYPKLEAVTYATEDAITDWNKYEIIILVNGDTASAAEIIAATLREYFPQNARILGETTYGKGTVQELINFDDASLLKYTIARWVTAKNKTSFDGVGITPDTTVIFDRNLWRTKHIDSQLVKAEKYNFSL